MLGLVGQLLLMSKTLLMRWISRKACVWQALCVDESLHALDLKKGLANPKAGPACSMGSEVLSVQMMWYLSPAVPLQNLEALQASPADEPCKAVGVFWRRLCKRLRPVAQKAVVLRD